MKVQVKRIQIGSAFRIGAVMSGLLFLVALVPLIFIQSVAFSMFMVSSSTSGAFPPTGPTTTMPMSGNMPGVMGLFGVAGICIAVGFGTVIYGIVGGVFSALAAFVYNLVSGWVGGLQFDLEDLGDIEKVKNDF